MNNQNPASYLDWFKNQPTSARNMAAVGVEVSRLKWLKEQETKLASLTPAAPTPKQYKADLAKSKAQREEQARIKDAQLKRWQKSHRTTGKSK